MSTTPKGSWQQPGVEPLLEPLSQRFKRFAKQECRNSSPLYERLSAGIAGDPEILSLAAHAPTGQPAPNLLLGAVHFLLLQGTQHPLSAFYPSLSEASHLAGDPYPLFRSFCLEQSNKIRKLISSRLVQTNEVQRCACLLPAFSLVARQAQGRPLSLVEIGASAGLNLLWDRYGYDYGEGRQYGDVDSPVHIVCTLRGGRRPPIPADFPKVAFRVGVDLDPIDVRDPEMTLWLRALVWPEHKKRASLLDRAIQVAQHDPPTLIAGDALGLLSNIVETVPRDTALYIFHTHTVNQFSPEAREGLSSLIADQGRSRDLVLVSIEWLGGEHPLLGLVSFKNGVRTEMGLAWCDAHGEWLDWQHA
ncbi:MAG: DUF2332 domain-containing protein, partial [Candidatus Methylomirabilales bacterium]